MELITSRQNPLCTHLRKLASSGSYRRKTGEFLCDSPKLVEEALLWNGDLHTVVFTENAALPTIPADVRCVQVPSDVMTSVSPALTPQGVLAVCGLHPAQLPKTLAGKRYMVLDGVQDPGNVGTIIRTANAAGYEEIYLTEECADPYSPKSVRASMSGVFFTKLYRGKRGEILSILEGTPIVVADMGGENVFTFKAPERFALAIGNEANGISTETFSNAAHTVKSPMQATQESLNAAISAGIIMYVLNQDEFNE